MDLYTLIYGLDDRVFVLMCGIVLTVISLAVLIYMREFRRDNFRQSLIDKISYVSILQAVIGISIIIAFFAE